MSDDYFTIASEACGLDTGGVREIRVRLAGEFDLGARDELHEALLGIIGNRRPGALTVDLAGVTFMDSEAISAIIGGYVAAGDAGVRFHVVNAQGVVRRVLEVIGLPALLAGAPPDHRARAGH